MVSEAVKQELRQSLREFLTSHGLKHTRQRELVAETFFETHEHVSAEELFHSIRAEHDGIGYATVYRTLKLLKEAGLAAERHFGEGFARFEPIIPGHHHDHLICTECDRIVEFENPAIEELQELVALREGFDMTHHRMELYGICSDCQSTRSGKPARSAPTGR